MSRQIYAVCLKCLFSLVLLLSLAMPALAQSSSSAAVNGTVQDTTDARIPNATVKLVSTTTGLESHTTTSKDGNFTLPIVKPGQYTLQIERDGFDTTQLTGIVLNVGDNRSVVIHMKVGSKNETVTVDGSGLAINTTDASVSTVVDRKFVANIPLNGRSFQDLISMTPGVVTQSPQNTAQASGATGDFSVNGQRTQSNYYTIDGVSANISSGNGAGVGQPASGGTVGGATALGTTQTLVSVDALEEFRVLSSTYSAEFGRSPGGQFSLATRSGTNIVHGSAFDYLRNNFFDANDWFNDHYGVPTPGLHQNDFGGTLGGPVVIPRLYHGKDRTFFFFSYEGLRLTRPIAATIQYVPDLAMRQQAVAAMKPILNAFPLPNGPDFGSAAAPNLAEFIAPYTSPSSIDATSVRIDHTINSKFAAFFRAAVTPSSTVSRPYLSRMVTSSNAQTYTLGLSSQLKSTMSNEARLGYARSDSAAIGTLDNFGGATPTDLTSDLGAGSFQRVQPEVSLSIDGIGSSYLTPYNARNEARQWNVIDTFTLQSGHHTIKAGLDYRAIKSPILPPALQPYVLFETPQQMLSGQPLALVSNFLSATPIFKQTALFANDTWRLPHLTLSLGLRWELSPPPTERHGNQAYTLTGSLSNPSTLTLAPRGTSLWNTSWLNFAPRLGMAWTVHSQPGRETVVRAGGGVFFDSANEVASLGYSDIGFRASEIITAITVPLTTSQLTVPITVTAPYTSGVVVAYPRHLQLPYTLQWNVSLQQALGQKQTFTTTYVAAAGRRLLQAQQQYLTTLNPNFGTVEYFAGGVTSNYQALQLQFQRSIGNGLQALVAYTWSHAIDFGSSSIALPLQRGDADFDVRHNLQAGVSWDLPIQVKGSVSRALLGRWGADFRVNERTAFPVTLGGALSLDTATGSEYYSGLNVVPGRPIYLYGSQFPGGRAINPAAFAVPPTGATGDAPRNLVRGFDESQLNLALRKDFVLKEPFILHFRAETFNLLNHPNFGYIDPNTTDALFGQATQSLNASLGTVASQYQQGGARSMQFALKLTF